VSKSDIGPIPHFPLKSASLKVGIDSPMAVITPSPVMATRLEVLLIIGLSRTNS